MILFVLIALEYIDLRNKGQEKKHKYTCLTNKIDLSHWVTDSLETLTKNLDGQGI